MNIRSLSVYSDLLSVYLDLFDFFSIMQFLVYKSYTSFVKFIPNYFIIYYKQDFFLILQLDCSLLYYLFYILQLYLKLFINSHIFIANSLGFSAYSVMSSAASYSLIRMPLISFSCLIALARMSGTVLSRLGQSGHLCLVSLLRWGIFSLLGLDVIRHFVVVFIRLRELPFIPGLLSVSIM